MKREQNVPVKVIPRHDDNATWLDFYNRLGQAFKFGFKSNGQMFFQKEDELQRSMSDILYKAAQITPAEIVALYTVPKVIVPAPGPGKALLFVDGVLNYVYGTATYTGGGNVQLRCGTVVMSAAVSAGNSFGAAANRIVTIAKLDTANGLLLTENETLNVNNLTGAFVNPGTAVGYGVVHCYYKIVDLTQITD